MPGNSAAVPQNRKEADKRSNTTDHAFSEIRAVNE